MKYVYFECKSESDVRKALFQLIMSGAEFCSDSPTADHFVTMTTERFNNVCNVYCAPFDDKTLIHFESDVDRSISFRSLLYRGEMTKMELF